MAPCLAAFAPQLVSVSVQFRYGLHWISFFFFDHYIQSSDLAVVMLLTSSFYTQSSDLAVVSNEFHRQQQGSHCTERSFAAAGEEMSSIVFGTFSDESVSRSLGVDRPVAERDIQCMSAFHNKIQQKYRKDRRKGWMPSQLEGYTVCQLEGYTLCQARGIYSVPACSQ